MADQRIQVLDVMTKITSAKQSMDSILSTVQQAIAQIDHCAATMAEWQTKLAAGEFDKQVATVLQSMMSLGALQTALADQQKLKAALVAYRDAHQGA